MKLTQMLLLLLELLLLELLELLLLLIVASGVALTGGGRCRCAGASDRCPSNDARVRRQGFVGLEDWLPFGGVRRGLRAAPPCNAPG